MMSEHRPPKLARDPATTCRCSAIAHARRRGVFGIILLAAATTQCLARYSYLVPTREVTQQQVNVGSSVTLRTSYGSERNALVDDLRLPDGRPFVIPDPESVAPRGASTDLLLLHTTERTRAPIWGALPLTFLGMLIGGAFGVALCFEGCRDPGVTIAAVASTFTLAGSLLGWGIGGLIGAVLTSPRPATIVDPAEGLAP